MNKVFYAFTQPQFRRRSILFIVIAIVLIIISSIIPTSNNAPKLILAYIAAGLLILSFIHQWEKPKKYLLFTVYTIVVFIISVILHNLLEVVSQKYISNEILSNLINSIGVFFFLVAVFLCPSAALVGIIGSIYLFIRNKFLKANNQL